MGEIKKADGEEFTELVKGIESSKIEDTEDIKGFYGKLNEIYGNSKNDTGKIVSTELGQENCLNEMENPSTNKNIYNTSKDSGIKIKKIVKQEEIKKNNQLQKRVKILMKETRRNGLEISNKDRQILKEIRNKIDMRIDIKNHNISRLSPQIRNIICENIYKKLSYKQDNQSLDLIKKESLNFLNLLKPKLNDTKIEEAFNNYFYDMVLAIKELRNQNALYKKKVIENSNQIYKVETKPLNIKKLATDIKCKNGFKQYSQSHLELMLTELFDYLTECFADFTVERMKKSDLFDDKEKKLKECGQCHKILQYKNFQLSFRNKARVRDICNSCSNDLQLIRYWRNKLKVVINGFGGTCSECNIGIMKLPSLEVHHLDPEKKTIAYKEIKFETPDEVLKKLKTNEIEMICSNCHSLKQATTYINFKDIINKKDLLKHSPNEIEKMINKEIEKISYNIKPSAIYGAKRNIKKWIKKRYISEVLFNGKCVGCGHQLVESFLPAMDLHHIDELVEKKSKWQQISQLPLPDIIKIIVEEKAVAICSNCHNFIHTSYSKYIDDIINSEALREEIKEEYDRITKNISNFSLNIEQIDYKDPLTPKIASNEKWKLYSLIIYDSILKEDLKVFTNADIKDSFQGYPSSIHRITSYLIRKKIIKKVGTSSGRSAYKFTDKGKKFIKIFEKEHGNIQDIIKDNIDKIKK